MRRTQLVAVMSAGLASVAVGAFPATAQQTRTCSQLAGPSLVENPAVKVVKEPAGEGVELYSGCVLPEGPVRSVAREGAEGRELRRVTLLASAGPFVAWEEEIAELVDGGGTVKRRVVMDLATGAKRSVRDPCAVGGTIVRALLGPDGRLVVLARCNRTVLMGVGPKGRHVYLDVARPGMAIPPESVSLEGRTVRWTRGTAGRTGRI